MLNTIEADAARVALSKFGISKLKTEQTKIICAVMDGADVLGILPTGYGKSLTYQIPSMLCAGTAIVFSPLVSLMKDQVDKLKTRGLLAERVTGGMSDTEVARVFRRASRYNLIYAAPERLKSTTFLKMLADIEIPFIAVDEAHVVSTSQQTFRPAYSMIGPYVRRMLPTTPLMALTATADPRIERDIALSLRLRDYVRVVAPFDRPNLEYRSVSEYAPEDIDRFIRDRNFQNESGLVYAATRSRVMEIAKILKERGLNAVPYHAGMSEDHRGPIQDGFMRGKYKIVVATNAFGMGVDKPNVRYVFHADPPGSVHDWAQEAGRAGRDGKPAVCVLNITSKGIRSRRFFLRVGNPRIDVVDAVWDTLKAKAPVRQPFFLTTMDVEMAIRRGCRVSSFDPPFMVEPVLSYMEYRGLIQRKPEYTMYKLTVRDRGAVQAIQRANFGTVVLSSNIVKVFVRPEGEDIAQRMISMGIVAPPERSPLVKYRAIRVKANHEVTEDELQERHQHEVSRLQTLLDFAQSPNKASFLRRTFLRPV